MDEATAKATLLGAGVHQDVVTQAETSIGNGVLLNLLIQYGPIVLQFLAQIFGWKLPPLPFPVPGPLPIPQGHKFGSPLAPKKGGKP